MEFQEHLAEKEVWFDVFAKDADLVDQLAFIYLVCSKFRGKEVGVSTIGSEEDMIFQVVLRFPDWDRCSDAKAHCRDKIDNFGNVITSYKGALDNIDPSRRFARKLKAKAEKNPQD
jgi:hypothetical protein